MLYFQIICHPFPMFWLCSGEIKSQYPKYCLTAAWRVLVTLYFSAIISPLNKTNCWRIFFPNIDGVKSTALWNSTKKDNINSSVQFSCSVVSDSLRPHGLQHTNLSYPSLSPAVCPNMSTESVMPSSHLILCCPLLLLPSIFPSIRIWGQVNARTEALL